MREEEGVGEGERDFVDSREVEAWQYIIVSTRLMQISLGSRGRRQAMPGNGYITVIDKNDIAGG